MRNKNLLKVIFSEDEKHSVHWGINPPQKHYPLFLAKPPLKFANWSSPPFLGNPPSILVFHEPPLNIGFFSEPPKDYSFSSLTPSYLLKVT